MSEHSLIIVTIEHVGALQWCQRNLLIIISTLLYCRRLGFHKLGSFKRRISPSTGHVALMTGKAPLVSALPLPTLFAESTQNFQELSLIISWLCIPRSNTTFATVGSVFAPTLSRSDKVNERFYTELSCTLRSVPATDKLLGLGDLMHTLAVIIGPVVGC